MAQVEWGEFKLGDLFEVHSYKKRFDANKVTIKENGSYPYVVRTALNNGIRGYIDEDTKYLNEGNTISFGQDTATMFYQERPYFTGDKIKILKPKDNGFNKNNAQFLLAIMSKSFSSYSWGTTSFSVNKIKNQNLFVPVKNNDVDYVFMESFVAELEALRIAELEALRIAELEAYLKSTGLKDYQLSEQERSAILALNNGEVEFKDFKIIDIFNVKNTYNILSRDIVENSGSTPYLSAGKDNNSVSSYISYNTDYLDKGNCIFIGGKTFVVTYQNQDFFSNDSHNLCLYFKNKESATKLNQLFMISCIEKGLKHQYSWGNSISNRKIQKDVFLLPIKDNQPDYEYMQTLISAVQKLVIKDVVTYSEQKMQAYQSVLNTQKI